MVTLRSLNQSDTDTISLQIQGTAYAKVMFALSLGLMLSDFMSRQVLNGVFPLLRRDWDLNDGRLGMLSGVVPVMVAVLVLPLSLAADRFGRVKSVVAMALLWSLATMACGFAASYGQMLAARVFVGVGEAAYGSVGVAVLLGLFPFNQRATVSGSFMAGAVFGSVLGVAVGANVAASFGWRWAFHVMAAVGVALSLAYWVVARRANVEAVALRERVTLGVSSESFRRLLAQLLSRPALVFAYAGSGLQLFVASAFITWTPSYFHSAYHLDIGNAGSAAAIFTLLSGLGMVVCGVAADRAEQRGRGKRISLAVAFCLFSFVAIGSAFLLQPGASQLILLGIGMFFVTGIAGVVSAVIADGTDAAVHATALAVLAVANNLIGLAPAPIITGLIADRLGLPIALALVPLASLGAAAAFHRCGRHYRCGRV